MIFYECQALQPDSIAHPAPAAFAKTSEKEQSQCSVSVSAGASVVVLLEARDELANSEVLDHLLQDSVVADVDLLDLDLGLLGDEVHLSFSLLL